MEAGSAFAFAQSITTSTAALAVASGSAAVGASALAAANKLIESGYDDKAPPSVTWDDGEDFQPKLELLEQLVKEV